MRTELLVWIEWLRNYQSYQGKFSVPIARELERVLRKAHGDLENLQAEVEILRRNGGQDNGRTDVL